MQLRLPGFGVGATATVIVPPTPAAAMASPAGVAATTPETFTGIELKIVVVAMENVAVTTCPSLIVF